MLEQEYDHEWRKPSKDEPNPKEQVELARVYQVYTNSINLLEAALARATDAEDKVEPEKRVGGLYKKRDRLALKLLKILIPLAWSIGEKKFFNLGWIENNKWMKRDLVSDCKRVILDSLPKFNPSKGSLKGYAHRIILLHMRKFICDQFYPEGQREDVFESGVMLRRAKIQFEAELGREIKLPEVMKLMHRDMERCIELYKTQEERQQAASLKAKVTRKLVAGCLEYRHFLLYDKPGGDDDEEPELYVDSLEDEQAINPRESAEKNLYNEQLSRRLSRLAPPDKCLYLLRGVPDIRAYEPSVEGIRIDLLAQSMKLIDDMEAEVLSNGGNPRSIRKLREYVEQLPKPDAPLPELN